MSHHAETEEDLVTIVTLLANAPLGPQREGAGDSLVPYQAPGFEASHDGLKLH